MVGLDGLGLVTLEEPVGLVPLEALEPPNALGAPDALEALEASGDLGALEPSRLKNTLST